MSLETWKNEFYPQEASEATSSDEEAIEHSLKKWEGARRENLKKHSVNYFKHRIGTLFNCFYFDISSCALCHRYSLSGSCFSYRENKFCPIVEFQGYPCDVSGPIQTHSIWALSNKTPEPMIKLLEETKEFVLNQENS